jgi:hypothetical protein
MGILEILLKNGADPNTVAKGFCTPMHCAANSGWTSHAIALIDAGAEVYTGPECSPLCWAKDGSGSNHPVARLLREKLGPEGMKLIEDHQRQRSYFSQGESVPRPQPLATQPAVQPNLSRYGNARSRTTTLGQQRLQRDDTERSQAVRPVNSDRLCPTCANMSLDNLVRNPGYIHLPLKLVRESTIFCSFCKVIFDVLGEGRKIVEGDVNQVIVQAVTNELGIYQLGQTLCMLELKLSAGCFCDKSYGAIDRSLDFKNCRGEFETLKRAQVGIFTFEGIDYFFALDSGLRMDRYNRFLSSSTPRKSSQSGPTLWAFYVNRQKLASRMSEVAS